MNEFVNFVQGFVIGCFDNYWNYLLFILCKILYLNCLFFSVFYLFFYFKIIIFFVGQKYLKGIGIVGVCIIRYCVWMVYNIGVVIMMYIVCMDIVRVLLFISMMLFWFDLWILFYKVIFYVKIVLFLLSNNLQNVLF